MPFKKLSSYPKNIDRSPIELPQIDMSPIEPPQIDMSPIEPPQIDMSPIEPPQIDRTIRKLIFDKGYIEYI